MSEGYLSGIELSAGLSLESSKERCSVKHHDCFQSASNLLTIDAVTSAAMLVTLILGHRLPAFTERAWRIQAYVSLAHHGSFVVLQECVTHFQHRPLDHARSSVMIRQAISVKTQDKKCGELRHLWT